MLRGVKRHRSSNMSHSTLREAIENGERKSRVVDKGLRAEVGRRA
jgi:hypothetical protein